MTAAGGAPGGARHTQQGACVPADPSTSRERRRGVDYRLSDRGCANRQVRCQQALNEWLARLGRGGEPHDNCSRVLSPDESQALAALRARLEKAGSARRDRLPAVRRMHARLGAMHASTVDIVV